MHPVPFEPILPPDPRRRAKTPSLPSWVNARLTSLREDNQRDGTGTYRNVWTLPKTLMLRNNERAAIAAYCAALDQLLDQVPATNIDAESETHLVVTKMMLALPAAKANEAGTVATAEAYEVALDDVPSWAVASAMRLWYRGEHRHERHEQGERYDFDWRPGPAVLRKQTLAEKYRLAGRDLAVLHRLLGAVERIEYSDVDRAAMQQRLRALGLVSDPRAGVTVEASRPPPEAPERQR
jgi:hypothetical protein